MFLRKKDKTPTKIHPTAEPSKPSSRKSGNIPSIISSDMKILGNIISDGVVDIDGVVEGNVKCHTATVRNNGHIKGDVIAESVQVYGKIQGLIKARNVHFFNGCRAEGVIMHESITIEDGAFVDGRFKRSEKLELDDEAITTSEPKKLFAPDTAPQIDDSAFKTPDFLSKDTVEDATEVQELTETKAEKKPAKAKKQESVLDNLRLLSDAS
jgi:cytoskeletal protein CcmA (bactofilin family)